MGKRKIHVNPKKVKTISGNVTWIPIRRFMRREARPILEEIRQRKMSDPITISLTNYLLIRCISVMERYLKNHAFLYAKENEIDLKKIFKGEVSIENKEHSIVSNFNFANPKDINEIFSKMIGINFLKEIKRWATVNFRDYYYEDVHIMYTTPLHKNWNKFLKMFELRNTIVHDGGNANFQKHKEVRDMVENTTNFLVTADLTIR